MKGLLSRCLRCSRSTAIAAGERAHLVYFAAVLVEGHGFYALAAGGCLFLGVAAEAMNHAAEETSHA